MREFSSKPFKFDKTMAQYIDGSLKMNEERRNGSFAANANYDGLNVGYESSSSMSSKLCTLSQKTRDFIGENLIDIENTLKALNLDFLHTFNELEKNDSAETLFGENYAYDTRINPKILNTALNLTKIQTNYSSFEVSPKSTKSSQYSPLEKQIHQPQFNESSPYLNECSSSDKLLDGKRSSTPDTGFASRETNTSSRRGSQKSSYSPQDSHYSPSYSTQIDEARAAYVHLRANGSFPSRQRSMSFTENYDLKSPVLSEPQSEKMHNPLAIGRTISSDGQAVRTRPRNAIAHKPKSIRARNLRRLSYNPIILDSSSSSNSDNEFDHRSIAQSESDIRSKIFTRNYRHSNQSLNRKSAQYQSNISFTPSHDKLYGSNASIKSAPQYNNYTNDGQLCSYLERKFNASMAQYNELSAHQVQQLLGQSSNFDRNARSSSTRRRQHQSLRNTYCTPPPPPPPSANRTYCMNSSSNFVYSQFDVSKLTGKSPTTQSFLQEAAELCGYNPSIIDNSVNSQQTDRDSTQQPQIKNSMASNSCATNTFQWPEKIHASAVTAQNAGALWPQKAPISSLHSITAKQQTSPPPPTIPTNAKSLINCKTNSQQFTSDSTETSSTETDFKNGDFNPRNPPSPAP